MNSGNNNAALLAVNGRTHTRTHAYQCTRRMRQQQQLAANSRTRHTVIFIDSCDVDSAVNVYVGIAVIVSEGPQQLVGAVALFCFCICICICVCLCACICVCLRLCAAVATQLCTISANATAAAAAAKLLLAATRLRCSICRQQRRWHS